MTDNLPSRLHAHIDEISHALTRPGIDGTRLLHDALERFPHDDRLWFFLGAHLASAGDQDGARDAFVRCLAENPDFHAGSFVLGFLELMTGHVDRAKHVWSALDQLPAQDSLKLVAQGLTLLTHDDLDGASEQLSRALQANTAFLPLNGYVSAVLAGIEESKADAETDGNVSANHLLLAGYLGSVARH